MTRYLLDTTVLIDLSKGRQPVVSLIDQFMANGADIGVCPVNVAEFYSGLPPERRGTWDEFFGSLAYWPITLTAAKRSGMFRYDFARRGTPLSTTDMLIAAVAQEQQAVIVTANVKDYPIEGIEVLPTAA